MKVINAGLETIEFGYNQNAKNKKEGGYYKVLSGEIIDVPEGAANEILNPTCGAGLRGLVVMDYGFEKKQCLAEGLEQYVKFCSERYQNEEQRAIEEEQVGKKRVGKNHRLLDFEAKFAKAEKALEDFNNGIEIYVNTSTTGTKSPSKLGGQANRNKSEVQLSAN